jgi:hypothetical protein
MRTLPVCEDVSIRMTPGVRRSTTALSDVPHRAYEFTRGVTGAFAAAKVRSHRSLTVSTDPQPEQIYFVARPRRKTTFILEVQVGHLATNMRLATQNQSHPQPANAIRSQSPAFPKLGHRRDQASVVPTASSVNSESPILETTLCMRGFTRLTVRANDGGPTARASPAEHLPTVHCSR